MRMDETLSVIATEREGIFIVKSPNDRTAWASRRFQASRRPSLCRRRGPRQAGRGQIMSFSCPPTLRPPIEEVPGQFPSGKRETDCTVLKIGMMQQQGGMNCFTTGEMLDLEPA